MLAWHDLSVAIVVGGRGRGSPANKFLAGVPSTQGGAGSGVRLALLMDPAVLALCPARCHLTCHVWGRGDCHPTSQMRKSAQRGEATCPSMPSWQRVEPEFKPRTPGSRALVLIGYPLPADLQSGTSLWIASAVN